MSAVIEEHQSDREGSLLAWLVCFSAALFFFYEFLQMNMINSINFELRHEFSLAAASLGALSATYFLANVIFLIPAGMILDRFSTRRVILWALFICILGTILFSQATSIWTVGFARFLTGIGNGFAFLSCIRLASRWFPSDRMAIVVGLMVTVAMFGGAVAQTPLAFLVTAVGWRQALVYNAAIGVAILLFIYIMVRDYPHERNEQHHQELDTLSRLGVWKSVKKAILNPQNGLAGLYTSFLNLAIFVLGALWGNLYLEEVHNLTKTQAGNVTIMVFAGTIVGSPVMGFISDIWGRRRLPMIIAALLSFLTILLLIYGPTYNYSVLMLLFFMVGLFTSAQVLGYPVISESNHPAFTSTAMGFASVLIMGGGLISHPLFGWLLDYHWSHLYRGGTPMFSLEDFRLALVILPIAFGLAVLFAFLLKETNCQSIVQEDDFEH